jgi:tRNA(fMet)-specific endonuclease VapC
MTIADTDVLIDYLSGRGEAAAVERYLRLGTLYTTVISRFELLSGAKDPKRRARLEMLLEAVPSLELDTESADAAGEIERALQESGNTIGMADSLIAGIVINNRSSLLTRNRRHFERVPGLRLA